MAEPPHTYPGPVLAVSANIRQLVNATTMDSARPAARPTQEGGRHQTEAPAPARSRTRVPNQPARKQATTGNSWGQRQNPADQRLRDVRESLVPAYAG